MTKLIACLLPVLSLAACSRDTTVYPSLAPRTVEKLGFAEPEAPAVPPVVADPALDARVAAIAARMTAIVRGFDDALVKAQAAARATAARTVGTDAWLGAQAALAGLDDWRAQTSGLAAETSDLAAARAQALAPDYLGLTALQATMEAETARQDAAVGRVQASVPAA